METVRTGACVAAGGERASGDATTSSDAAAAGIEVVSGKQLGAGFSRRLGLRRSPGPGERARVLAAAALVALSAGCAGNRSPDNPMVAALEANSEIEILVRNLAFNQVTVYTAQNGGLVNRLGVVPGKGEATFTVRWHLPQIQLRVKQLAQGEFVTETLPVGPGELLELIIPSHW